MNDDDRRLAWIGDSEGLSPMDVDAISGWIKDIVLVVLGWLAPEAWKRVRRWSTLRLRAHVFPATAGESEQPTIYIRASFDKISYGKNPATLRGYTHAGDVQAVMNIYEAFDRLPVRLKFGYFDQINRDMKNIVLIGASSRSDVSREIGQELYDRGIRVEGIDEHAYFRDKQGVEYRCAHQEIDGHRIVTRDAGVIFRKRTQTGAIILLCGGIHTFGSQAAAEIAALPKFQKRVRDARYEQFVQFVTVDTIRSGPLAGLAIKDDTIKWEELPLEHIV